MKLKGTRKTVMTVLLIIVLALGFFTVTSVVVMERFFVPAVLNAEAMELAVRISAGVALFCAVSGVTLAVNLLMYHFSTDK